MFIEVLGAILTAYLIRWIIIAAVKTYTEKKDSVTIAVPLWLKGHVEDYIKTMETARQKQSNKPTE